MVPSPRKSSVRLTGGRTSFSPKRGTATKRDLIARARRFLCDNGSDSRGRRGVSQSVVLNQKSPEPIVASALSRCEGVDGSPGSDYALYLDLVYTDGTPLWGQTAPFDCGTHDWQRREVVIMPAKPVRQVSFYLLLRGRAGKAWFRNPRLEVVRAGEGASLFDGVPVQCKQPLRDGFQVRDVAAGSDFVRIDREALGLRLDQTITNQDGVDFLDVTLTDTTGRDRAVTFVYAVPVSPTDLQWLENPRESVAIEPGREYIAGRPISSRGERANLSLSLRRRGRCRPRHGPRDRHGPAGRVPGRATIQGRANSSWPTTWASRPRNPRPG